MKKNILFKRFSFYFLAFISAAAVFLVSSCSVTRRDPDSPPLYNDPEGLKAVDGDPDTYWVPRQEGAFTQITFETPKIINVVEIIENYSVVRDYHIEAWIDREWVKIYENDLKHGREYDMIFILFEKIYTQIQNKCIMILKSQY